MTKVQLLRKLKKATIELTGEEIEGIEFLDKDEIELFIPSDNNDGVADDHKTAILEDKVKKVINWGSYGTGYGGIVLQKGYQGKGDWNDKSSTHHY